MDNKQRPKVLLGLEREREWVDKRGAINQERDKRGEEDKKTRDKRQDDNRQERRR